VDRVRRAPIRFGPAGWDYKDWKGVVYPAPAPRGFDPLRYLVGYFDTIEVNSTFYGPMTAKVASTWVERVQDNEAFRFTAKLWRRFTHERTTAWTSEEVAQARETLDALAQARRLGAVLIQFPWSFRNDEKNQEWLRDVCAAFQGLPLVLEVRHASWSSPEVYSWLSGAGVGFVNIDQPLFKSSIKPSAQVTSRVAYVRVHGRNYRQWFRQKATRDERYDYLYSAKELEEWADITKALAEAETTDEVYVVTNNHFRGKAAANALMLQAMVEGERARAPEGLLEAYGETLGPYVSPSPPGVSPSGSSRSAGHASRRPAPRGGRRSP
jgi:uncharacterized protein YecE (DUF72 family)